MCLYEIKLYCACTLYTIKRKSCHSPSSPRLPREMMMPSASFTMAWKLSRLCGNTKGKQVEVEQTLQRYQRADGQTTGESGQLVGKQEGWEAP